MDLVIEDLFWTPESKLFSNLALMLTSDTMNLSTLDIPTSRVREGSLLYFSGPKGQILLKDNQLSSFLGSGLTIKYPLLCI